MFVFYYDIVDKSLGLRKGPSCSKVAKKLTCNFPFFFQNIQSDPAERRCGVVHHQGMSIPSKAVIYIFRMVAESNYT